MRNRTSAPLLYVVAPYVIVVFSAFTFWRDFQAENWGNAVFAAFNAILATAAIVAYVGIGSSFVDIWIGLTKWLYVPVKPKKSNSTVAPEPATGSLDWRSVLYYGDTTGAGHRIKPPARPTASRRTKLEKSR